MLAQPINLKPIDVNEILGAVVGVVGIVTFLFTARRFLRGSDWARGLYGWALAINAAGLIAFVLMILTAMVLTVALSWLR